MSTSNNQTIMPFALGAYLGFVCGDALGATVEFMEPKQIQQNYGTHKDIIGGGWLRLQPGEVTDDTQMMMTLSQAIIDKQGWHLNTIADYFVQWLYSTPPDIGESCLRGIRRYQHTGETSGPPSEYDAGNGACMRNLPVVLITLNHAEYFEQFTLEQNHLTHNNPLSDAATLALGRMLKQLLLYRDISACQKESEKLIQQHKEFNYRPYPGDASGYIVHTMQTVLHFFYNTDNFEDCVVNTVNQGGDADTTGAIAGMLAGARYGVDAIPKRWIDSLNQQLVSQIEEQTQRLLVLAETIVICSE